MALIIGGHIRSGTTLLRNLCHSHPNIAVTMEFGCFRGLGRSYIGYSRHLLRRCVRRWNQSFLVQGKEENRFTNVLKSYAFVARYLWAVHKHQNGQVNVQSIEAALHTTFPDVQVVGDKSPRYIFLLDELAMIDGLTRVVIYRDCRDVAQSVLQKVRTQWQDKPFAKNWNSVDKIARSWVKAIALMERHQDHLYIIQYERFVQNPILELNRLGGALNVDPPGFPVNTIFPASIGKYQHSLSGEQLDLLMSIAGPTMARLGYV